MLRNVAICGSKIRNSISDFNFVDTIEINGFPVFCGLLHTQDKNFDQNTEKNNHKVLVRKKAFSCNYRDKSIIFQIATKALNYEDIFFAIGSDFVGEVIDIGAKVTELKIGDRVIANNAYPQADSPETLPGIPSNHGSKEYQIFHQAKLIKIPLEMSDEVAAAFSIGGQTSYSIVRKFNPTKDSNILITAAKSNTSLFVINALKKYGANIYTTTTSNLFVEELKAMGVKEVITIEKKPNSLLENKSIQKIVQETGGFDCVFDPFYDLYLGQAVELMNFGAKYITCGLYDQYFDLIGQQSTASSLNCSQIIQIALMKNLQIIGNCLGTSDDLKNALQDYASGDLKVIIDSVFTGNQIGDFLDRTYNVKDRFGKVVYQYS
jgi:NADPH:quinone reductase-like Zn-dependent oxidoreductase